MSLNSWLKLDDCLWLDPPWFSSGSQCWYFSNEPSSLFHHSVLVDLSVSVMMH